jgi:S1-C subfamily serine protease
MPERETTRGLGGRFPTWPLATIGGFVLGVGGLLVGLKLTHEPATTVAGFRPSPPSIPSSVQPATAPSEEVVDLDDTSSAIQSLSAGASPEVPVATTRPAAVSAQEIFRKASPAVVCILTQNEKGQTVGQGSGFFVGSDGLIVTNLHVLGQARSAKVIEADGPKWQVLGVAATDTDNDLAIIKIEKKPTVTLALSQESRPPIGTHVWAIGSPEGLTNSISEGIVSGLRELPGKRKIIQTTAAITHGSSG